MLMALEVNIVSPSGIRIPLMTQFIENPDGEYDKQDCEPKAAKRLLGQVRAPEADHTARQPVPLRGHLLYLPCERMGTFRNCE